MSGIDTKEDTSVLDESVGRKKSAPLCEVMFRIKPELYAALQAIVVGRDEVGSCEVRRGSVAAIIREIVQKHEVEIMEEAATYLRWSVVQSKLARSRDVLARRRPKE